MKGHFEILHLHIMRDGECDLFDTAFLFFKKEAWIVDFFVPKLLNISQ